MNQLPAFLRAIIDPPLLPHSRRRRFRAYDKRNSIFSRHLEAAQSDRHISNSYGEIMKKAAVLLFAFLAAMAVTAVFHPDTFALADAGESSHESPASNACLDLPGHVKALGSEPDPSATIEQLHACGRRAVPLLVSELRVVDPENVNAEWWHVAWVERALRSITGQYFRFSADEKPGETVESRSRSKKMGFVTERMANGRVTIAPRDVQARVIRAWQDWLKDNTDSFPLKDFKPYGEWFF